MSIGFNESEALRRANGRLRIGVECEYPGMVRPEFKDSCDVKNLLDRFRATGSIISDTRRPLYGDYSAPIDYQTALNIQIRAKEQFEGLPAKLRDRFNNDPLKFLEFVSDESNIDEARVLGLLPKAEVPVEQPTGEAVGEEVSA